MAEASFQRVFFGCCCFRLEPQPGLTRLSLQQPLEEGESSDPNKSAGLGKKMKAISLTMRRKMGKKHAKSFNEETVSHRAVCCSEELYRLRLIQTTSSEPRMFTTPSERRCWFRWSPQIKAAVELQHFHNLPEAHYLLHHLYVFWRPMD